MSIGEFIRSRPPLEPYLYWTASSRWQLFCFRLSVAMCLLTMLLYGFSFSGLVLSSLLAVPYCGSGMLVFAIGDVSLRDEPDSWLRGNRWPFRPQVPMWLRVACCVAFGLTLFHFILATSEGSPEVVEGMYVMARKGLEFRVISREAYLLAVQREFRFALSFGGMLWWNASACWWVQLSSKKCSESRVEN